MNRLEVLVAQAQIERQIRSEAIVILDKASVNGRTDVLGCGGRLSGFGVEISDLLVRSVVAQTPHIAEVINRSRTGRVAVRVLLPIQIGAKSERVISLDQSGGVPEIVSCLREHAWARRAEVLQRYCAKCVDLGLRKAPWLLRVARDLIEGPACHIEPGFV